MDVSLDLLTHTHDHACPRARIVLQIIHRLFKFPFCSNLLALNNLHSILFYFSSIMWAPSFNFLNLKLEINIKYNYPVRSLKLTMHLMILINLIITLKGAGKLLLLSPHVCFFLLLLFYMFVFFFFFYKIDDFFFFFFFFCFFNFFSKLSLPIFLNNVLIENLAM
jgi:hypothetical protein